jgi:hypothetical protein
MLNFQPVFRFLLPWICRGAMRSAVRDHNGQQLADGLFRGETRPAIAPNLHHSQSM